MRKGRVFASLLDCLMRRIIRGSIWLIYFYPFQSHLKRLGISDLQIFGSSVTRSVNKKHERQIVEYHGSAPFLNLKKMQREQL